MKVCDIINLNEILDPNSNTNNMDTVCPHCSQGLFNSIYCSNNILYFNWSCGFQAIQSNNKNADLTKMNKCIISTLCSGEIESLKLPQTQKKCCCGSHDLFNFGCRCGGE